MKSPLIPGLALVLLYACFLGSWIWCGYLLPEHVASHFDANGKPNGWMSHSAHQTFMLLFGLFFPLFIVLVCYLTRLLPPGLVNIPNRDYWLAPERGKETADYLFGHSLWLACLLVCFVMGLEYSIVQANRLTPARLSNSMLFGMLIPFLAGVGAWVVLLYRHFRLPR